MTNRQYMAASRRLDDYATTMAPSGRAVSLDAETARVVRVSYTSLVRLVNGARAWYGYLPVSVADRDRMVRVGP